MAYIKFSKSELHADVVVALREDYKPSDKVNDLIKRLSFVRTEVEEIERLIESINKDICPNYDEFMKQIKNLR